MPPGPDTLPLLALTLERLYTDYASTGQLTLANYKSKSIGGMREVVNNEIEQILQRDPHERETALRRLRAAFIPNLVEIIRHRSLRAPAGARVRPARRQPAARSTRWWKSGCWCAIGSATATS